MNASTHSPGLVQTSSTRNSKGLPMASVPVSS